MRPVYGWSAAQNDLAVRLASFLNYDIIHIQEEAFAFFESDVATRLAELKPGVPVVVTLHELHQERASFASVRKLLERADVIVANDRRTAERCQEHVGRKVDKVLFSPSPVDPPPDNRRRRKIPGLVCTFGLINRLKRLDILYEALKLVRKSHPEVVWRIVGPFDPTRDSEHREVLEMMGHEPWIRFTGSLDAKTDLPESLDEAEILLLPFDDGASLRRTSLHVGWRFGLPIVTTEAKEEDIVFQDGKNVLFAEREAPESWETCITRLLEDPALRQTMSRCGLETSAAFSISSQARDYLAIYDRLMR